jgi:hypothetical protein
MSRTRTSIYTLIDLFHFMETGRVAVPSFQRGYVWGREAVRQLFISINSGYPIGTLIAVETQADHFEVIPADLSLFPTPKESFSGDRLWIIDGAQRVAALYNGLFSVRKPFALLYDLRCREFCFPNQAASDAPLLKMSSLFSSKELMLLQASLANDADGEPLLAELNAVRERFYSYSIPLLVVAELADFELVDIFARINSTGLALTKKEIARAKKHTSRK